ncbi:MAG: efflux RND transporter periplasmic adaptor subunit [Patescibacteria group bacterium]
MNYFKKPWVLAVLGIVIVIAVFLVFSGKSKSPFETARVVRGSVSEEVSVTGKVKPAKNVDLAFEKSGRIAAVNAQVGDRVYIGESVIALDAVEFEAQLSKAEADLAAQNSDLAKAEIILSNYYGSIPDILNNAYAKADDAVRKQLDALFTNDDLQNPSLTFQTKDIAIDNNLRQLRLSATSDLAGWSSDLAVMAGMDSKIEFQNYLVKSKNYLTTVRSLLSKAMEAVVNAADSSLTQSLIDSYKTNINTARTNVNAVLADITDQEQSISAQKAAVASLEANVKSYEAGLANIKAQISKTVIYSPISGVVTFQNAKVGEIASPGALMVSIISASNFEVEANVPEADIAKIKVGEEGTVTLDTYGNDIIFNIKVSSIEPAETVVEGVATYKTKFQFLKNDDRVKSGMTANITVFTDKRENALTIPQRAVTNQNGEKFVLVDKGNGVSEKRVIETGLRGVDGNVEILKGLEENESVITNNL